MDIHDFLFWLVSLEHLSPKRRYMFWEAGKILSDSNRATFVSALIKQEKLSVPSVELTTKIKMWDHITILDDAYPKILKEIAQPPLLLFYKGDITLLQERGVAIVGSRLNTEYGEHIVMTTIKSFVDANIVTISGAAKGIDGLVHRATLAAKGKTVAVLGHGLPFAYPKEHKALINVIGKKGLLVSEYLPWVGPKQWHFPARNRIIVGLSQHLWIVEAELKSGSLISAQIALDENREIWCTPGDVTRGQSKGTNQLISDGSNVLIDGFSLIEQIKYMPENI